MNIFSYHRKVKDAVTAMFIVIMMFVLPADLNFLKFFTTSSGILNTSNSLTYARKRKSLNFFALMLHERSQYLLILLLIWVEHIYLLSILLSNSPIYSATGYAEKKSLET